MVRTFVNRRPPTFARWSRAIEVLKSVHRKPSGECSKLIEERGGFSCWRKRTKLGADPLASLVNISFPRAACQRPGV
jgi:hypothetical protein